MMRPYEEARERLAELEDPGIPTFTTRHTYRQTPVFEVTGPMGESLLIAFGLIPLAHWLEVVNAYHVERTDESEPWNPEDPEKVVQSLNRLRYARVEIVLNEHDETNKNPFTIEWGTRGLDPITTWVIKNK